MHLGFRSHHDISFEFLSFENGGVAEWSKAAVLKTVEPRGSEGSNPFSSAKHDEQATKMLGESMSPPTKRGWIG